MVHQRMVVLGDILFASNPYRFHSQLCCHRHNFPFKTAQAKIRRSPHIEPSNNGFLFSYHLTTMEYTFP